MKRLNVQANEIFYLQFISSLGQPGPLINGLNYFRFWLRFCWVIRTLVSTKWLAGVSYPGEINSPGYHILANPILKLKIRITRWILNQNRKYVNPLVSSPGWFNDEKNGDWKSRWTVPLTYTYLDKIGLEMGVLMFVTAHVMMSDSVELKNLKKRIRSWYCFWTFNVCWIFIVEWNWQSQFFHFVEWSHVPVKKI